MNNEEIDQIIDEEINKFLEEKKITENTILKEDLLILLKDVHLLVLFVHINRV